MYFLSVFQKLAWQNKEAHERKTNYMPQKYSSLRAVPAYNRFINERFQRCLDLYLCPRKRIVKVLLLRIIVASTL